MRYICSGGGWRCLTLSPCGLALVRLSFFSVAFSATAFSIAWRSFSLSSARIRSNSSLARITTEDGAAVAVVAVVDVVEAVNTSVNVIGCLVEKETAQEEDRRGKEARERSLTDLRSVLLSNGSDMGRERREEDMAK